MIQNEIQYKAIEKRINELLELVDDNTLPTDSNYIELDLLSGWIEKYEDEHYPIDLPS